MKGEEKQGVFPYADKRKDAENKLRSNRKPGDKKPYMVMSVDGKEDLRYYDQNDLDKMRGLGYGVRRVIDPLREIKSIDFISDSEVMCEICEEKDKKTKGQFDEVFKGEYRVGYKGGKDNISEDKADFVMVCGQHKPNLEEPEKKVEDHEMTEYTKWINDH